MKIKEYNVSKEEVEEIIEWFVRKKLEYRE